MSISLAVQIYGANLDPQNVTVVLAVQPMLARKKGEVSRTKLNKEILQKSGVWAWYSDDESGLFTLDDHVQNLEKTFSHTYANVSRLDNVERAVVDICVIATEKTGNVSAFVPLSSRSMSILHQLGLPVEFTFYGLSED
jgi:hypothetical protein